MTIGNTREVRVHYKGNTDDFIVFVENAEAVRNWLKDRSIPLAEVMDSFQVFVTGGQGAQGILNKASKQQLNTEFGGTDDDSVITHILEKGTVLETRGSSKEADKNPTNGPGVASRGGIHN